MSDDLIEKLAAGEHEQWADWAQNILDTEPGLSEIRKTRWPDMISTKYENLPEELKDKDRREVYLRSKPALDEIKRLQSPVKDQAWKTIIDAKDTKIAALEAENLQLQVAVEIGLTRLNVDYVMRLENAFVKACARMFWHENSWEGECSFDVDEVARSELENIRCRQ